MASAKTRSSAVKSAVAESTAKNTGSDTSAVYRPADDRALRNASTELLRPRQRCLLGRGGCRLAVVIRARRSVSAMVSSGFVTFDLYVKPERLDEFLGVLRQALPDTRAYQGCESLETFTDMDHRGHVILVERWSERAAHERYFAWREEQGMRAVIMDFLANEDGGFHYFEPRPDV